MIEPLYSLSGFAVGLLVGMTGVGGGALMTPILIMLFGVHPATAVGTDLLYAAATKTGGSLVHGSRWSSRRSCSGLASRGCHRRAIARSAQNGPANADLHESP